MDLPVPEEKENIKEIRITFTANGRNDHVMMFILHLPLAVLSIFIDLCTHIFRKQMKISCLQ